MDKEKYKQRLIDRTIDEYLGAVGAVCIEGPKWCGKTWTSAIHSKSSIYIGDPARNFANRKLAEIDPSIVLKGEAPRLVDEWQEVPSLWDAVRYKVDESGEKGQFILTGSSTPKIKGILHGGTGRIARLTMHPMSLFEMGKSSGLVSLQRLCKGELENNLTGEVSLIDLAEFIIRGGWPATIDLPFRQAALLPKTYFDSLGDDITRLEGKRLNIDKIMLLLKSLARNESATASKNKLQNDVSQVNDEKISIDSIDEYLDVLGRMFIIDNQLPFSPSARSSLRVKQQAKRHLADPSLTAALLNQTPKKLTEDLETFGFLFEALAERDLKIYAESFGAKMSHYQDYANNEIDAVIENEDGSWAAIEIKLGANQIDAAASNLIRTKRTMEKDPHGKPPSVLIVVCGLSNAAYKREDGVFVVPLTALRN